MPEPDAIVIVVDDDESFRRSTERLIRSAGFKVQSFGAATEFLKAERPNAHACVVLDVRMPGLSGLDLQKELAQNRHRGANHLHHRARRHSDVRAGHESRGS